MPPDAADTQLRALEHYDEAEQVAAGTKPLDAPTAIKLTRFRESVRAKLTARDLSSEQRRRLRERIIIPLSTRTAAGADKDDYDRLSTELEGSTTGNMLETAREGVVNTFEKGKDMFNNAPDAVKFGIVGVAAVAGFALLMKLFSKTRSAAAAVGGAAVSVGGATLSGGKKLLRWAMIGGIAIAGFMGIGYLTKKAEGADGAGETPEKIADKSFERLGRAIRDGNATLITAYSTELGNILKANPTLAAKYMGKEFTHRDGKVRIVQQEPGGTVILIEKERAVAAEAAAAIDITALGPTPTKQQIIDVLAKNAGTPAKTDLVGAFLLHFRDKITIGGKKHLVQFNKTSNLFVLMDQEQHEAAKNTARATLDAAKVYADPAAWSTEVNALIANPILTGDQTLRDEILASCAAGKRIGDKQYLLQADGAINVKAVEDTRLSAVKDGEKLKGKSVEFTVMRGTTEIKAALDTTGDGAKAVELRVGTHKYNILTRGVAGSNNMLTDIEKVGPEIKFAPILGSVQFMQITELENIIVALANTPAGFTRTVPSTKLDGTTRKPDTTAMEFKKVG